MRSTALSKASAIAFKLSSKEVTNLSRASWIEVFASFNYCCQ
jgi:hypothetical protein